MQIGQKKTTGQKMKKERNRGRETDRKPNISQIQKTGEHCIYAKRCGGCDYQGILYSQQLSKKQSYMRKLMEPFGKINPIIGMDDPYHYRHKVQAAFSCNKRGHIVAGVYVKNIAFDSNGFPKQSCFSSFPLNRFDGKKVEKQDVSFFIFHTERSPCLEFRQSSKARSQLCPLPQARGKSDLAKPLHLHDGHPGTGVHDPFQVHAHVLPAGLLLRLQAAQGL